MLPGMSGFDTLRHIRAKSQIPVIMLTAKGDDVDRIVGLEMGADDYITKPVQPEDLLAAVQGKLRRAEQLRHLAPASFPPTASQPKPADAQGQVTLLVGPLTIDGDRQEVWLRGSRIRLSSRSLNPGLIMPPS